MRRRATLLVRLLLLAAVRAFGPLFSSEAGRESIVLDSCARCKGRLGHTLGNQWMECVTDDLFSVQRAAKLDGSRKYFPVEQDELKRLLPGGLRFGRSDELANILRNYSCEVVDGGSQPLRSFNWTYRPADPCDAASGSDSPGGGSKPQHFAYGAGFLPAGNDLRSEQLTEAAAQESCWADSECAGFTYSFQGTADERSKLTHRILFKRSAEGQSSAEGWHTWRRLRQLDCTEAARRRRSTPMVMRVNVLRESPPVYTVDDFVGDGECEQMVAETVPKMGRSVVGGGGTSTWRQSFSVNMVPDFDDEDHLITCAAVPL